MLSPTHPLTHSPTHPLTHSPLSPTHPHAGQSRRAPAAADCSARRTRRRSCPHVAAHQPELPRPRCLPRCHQRAQGVSDRGGKEPEAAAGQGDPSRHICTHCQQRLHGRDVKHKPVQPHQGLHGACDRVCVCVRVCACVCVRVCVCVLLFGKMGARLLF